jgi:hypothetical protein
VSWYQTRVFDTVTILAEQLPFGKWSELRKLFICRVTLFWEASTHNDTHATPSAIDSSAMAAAFEGMAIATTPASLAGAQDAIPGLLDDIVITHVLRSEHFDDLADLARLPAVSRAMRDAVAATGLEFKEIDEDEAANIGCLSAVQRLQRGGRLSRQE